MARYTASKLDRLFACTASDDLPQVETEKEEWTEAGTVVHEFLMNTSLYGRAAALELVPEKYRERCKHIDVARLPASVPGGFASEVGVAWDWTNHKGRELFRNKPTRGYKTEPTEAACTIDTVGLTETAAVIYDYKSGSRYLGRPRDSWQLKAQAVMACAAYGKNCAIVGFIKIDENGDPLFLVDEIDETELFLVAYDLSGRLSELAEKKTTKLVEGDHCRYCPAISHCPAKIKLAIALGKGEDLAPAVGLTDENFAEFYGKLERANKLIEGLKKIAHQFASARGGIPVGEGMIYGPKQMLEDIVDAEKAHSVLSEKYGAVIADVAVPRSFTKEALKEAMRSLDGKLSDRIDEAMGLLRIGGAAEVAVKVVVKKHPAPRQL